MNLAHPHQSRADPDGHSGTIADCWAHVRRKFVELEDIDPGRCTDVLDLISKLYDVERSIKDRPPDESASGESSAPSDRVHSGIWKGLGVFLDNPAVDLDNNRTKPLCGVVLGRKNHYGSRSVRGTEVAALFYSLIESTKLVGKEPLDYLLQATRAALSGCPIPPPHERV